MRASIIGPIFKAYPETDFGGIFETEADYRDPVVQELITDEGRLDAVAADPLLLQHAEQEPADGLSGEADLAAHRRRLRACGRDAAFTPAMPVSNGTGSAPTIRAATWSRAIIYGFRISVLFGLVLTIFSLDHRRGRRRGAGLFRRLDRPPVPALHRDLDQRAAALSADHRGRGDRAEFLDPARHPAGLFLGGAGRRRAGRVPARAQFRICHGGAGARPAPISRSSSGICCRTPWWRR